MLATLCLLSCLILTSSFDWSESGDAGCQKALGQALQRMTREELGSTIMQLIDELQLKVRVSRLLRV